MDLLPSFLDYIKANNLFRSTDQLLIAVSGGIDSVVLCHLCSRAGYSFSIAHGNFGLRGAESERDEAFVRDLAAKHRVPVFLNRFPTRDFAKENKLSIQEAARKLRYDWFDEIVNGQWTMNHSVVPDNQALPSAYDCLLTAHHLDDNVETVLMNFLKGTGISGVRGIQPRQGKIVRPLLLVHRSRIQEYAEHYLLDWVHDSSNDETKYTRNYFRHTVLPSIEKVFPKVRMNLAANIQRFADVEVIYKKGIEREKKRLIEIKGPEFHIPVLKLAKCTPLPTIVYEIIKDFGFGNRQVEEVIRLLKSESGKYLDASAYRILRNRAWLIIAPLNTGVSENILIEEGRKQVSFGNFTLLLKNEAGENTVITDDRNIALLDAKDIRFPLLLRKWKPGDYFYPLGMNKKKKLARFFIDARLSKNEKENVWVLESDKRIIWVMGHRIDDRFKVTAASKMVWRFQVNRQ